MVARILGCILDPNSLGNVGQFPMLPAYQYVALPLPLFRCFGNTFRVVTIDRDVDFYAVAKRFGKGFDCEVWAGTFAV